MGVLVVTVKVKAVPAVAVAVALLVMVGTASVTPAALTVRVIVWLVLPPALVAVTVKV